MYKLTNDEIIVKSSTVEATQKWTNFYKVKETKGFFLFYTGKIVATMLDKKIFNPSEIETLQRFIKSLPIEND